jgi:thiol-disulfide isomerase/thioredoxin
MPAFDPAVLSLTEGNFTSCTDKGMWLVEFFSPYCPHCKRLAPTWRDLADAERHLQDSSDFHMARVNCIAQGDLCSRNNILGYPSIELFRDGTWAETYEGDRSFDDLDAYPGEGGGQSQTHRAHTEVFQLVIVARSKILWPPQMQAVCRRHELNLYPPSLSTICCARVISTE